MRQLERGEDSERLKLLKRQMARGSFGIDLSSSPRRSGRYLSPLRTDDLSGAVWIPRRRQGQ
jgi:hypothetical protein